MKNFLMFLFILLCCGSESNAVQKGHSSPTANESETATTTTKKKPPTKQKLMARNPDIPALLVNSGLVSRNALMAYSAAFLKEFNERIDKPDGKAWLIESLRKDERELFTSFLLTGRANF